MVSANWKKFGHILRQEPKLLEAWEAECLKKADQCWCKVMQHWLTEDNAPYHQATWEGLISLLEDADYAEVARKLKIALTSYIHPAPAIKPAPPAPSSSGDQSMKSSITSEDSDLVQRIEKALDEDEKIDRKHALSVFIGQEGSGKSSLMYQLLYKKPPQNLKSTGVSDAVAIVELDTSSRSDWKTTELEEALIEHMCTSRSASDTYSSQKKDPQWKKDTSGPPPQIKAAANLESTLKLNPTSPELIQASASSSTQKDTRLESTIDDRGAVRPKANFLNDDAKQIINKYNYKKFSDLERRCSLYMRDAGGQVAYQEMIPLLVSVAAIFFFVFRADVALKEMFGKLYKIENNERYPASITVKESLFQCLANVFAMHTPRNSQEGEPKARVFLIATHIDKLNPSTKDEEIELLDGEFKSLIKGFEKLVLQADQNSLLFAVNNLSDNQEVFNLIRSKVCNLIATSDEFTVKGYPIRSLLFSLMLQNDKRITLSLKDCAKIAADLSIDGSEITEVLKFLHAIGIVQYYDIEGVKDFVVIKPKFLFESATTVISDPFPPDHPVSADQQRDWSRGILQLSVLKRTTSTIDPDCFVTILKHLRLIASVPGGQERYFFPCVLNRVRESQEQDLTSISPLSIQFECKHCPKGLFGVLITRLMDSDTEERRSSNNISLKLIEDKIFRDQVHFDISSLGTHDSISLRLHSTHIEIKYIPDKCEDRSRSLGEMCIDTRKLIHASIIKSLDNLHYNVTPEMCVECSNSVCGLHPVEEGGRHHRYHCSEAKRSIRIPHQGRWWYIEGSLNT